MPAETLTTVTVTRTTRFNNLRCGCLELNAQSTQRVILLSATLTDKIYPMLLYQVAP